MGKEKNLMESLSKVAQQYDTDVLKLITSQVSLTEKQATAIFTAKGLSGTELDAAVKTATYSAAQKEAAASTLSLGTATKGLWATMVAHPFN